MHRFQTIASDRIVLRTTPHRLTTWPLDQFLARCETELDKLTEVFGASISCPVTVYLFAKCHDFGWIFGRQSGGLALTACNSIVIAEENSPVELMRHELAHLFAAGISSRSPPLFQEGLAMWCQTTQKGLHVDDVATPLVYATKYKLSSLLKPEFFFKELRRHHCYLLAGSFTSYLIRRYGWEAYRQFYRKSDSVFMHWQFKRRFGLSLEKAEKEWRRKVVFNDE